MFGFCVLRFSFKFKGYEFMIITLLIVKCYEFIYFFACIPLRLRSHLLILKSKQILLHKIQSEKTDSHVVTMLLPRRLPLIFEFELLIDIS